MVIIQIRFLANPFCAFQIHNLFVDKIMHIIQIRFLFFSASKSTNLFVDKIMHIIQIRFFFVYSKIFLSQKIPNDLLTNILHGP